MQPSEYNYLEKKKVSLLALFIRWLISFPEQIRHLIFIKQSCIQYLSHNYVDTFSISAWEKKRPQGLKSLSGIFMRASAVMLFPEPLSVLKAVDDRSEVCGPCLRLASDVRRYQPSKRTLKTCTVCPERAHRHTHTCSHTHASTRHTFAHTHTHTTPN